MDAPTRRQKVSQRVLGDDAHLNRVARNAHVRLLHRQRLAARHTQLQLHQVQAGHRFGYRMLHLQASVHFQKREAARRARRRNSTVPALV